MLVPPSAIPVNTHMATEQHSRQSLPKRGLTHSVRAVNPHRFEMEMLSAVVLLDPARKLVVGYKDLTAQDFWVRGHMPGYPLFPGVLMCEAAAQLCCYYTTSQKVTDCFLAIEPRGQMTGSYPSMRMSPIC